MADGESRQDFLPETLIEDNFILMKKYEKIFDRIKYLIMLKNNISGVYSHKYTKIKINADED